MPKQIMKWLVFILNLPWTVLGLVIGILSIPKNLKFRKVGRAMVINVWRIWPSEIYMQRKVRGLAVGSTILLSRFADELTINHELVHIEQFQKVPLIFPLLYLIELVKRGYKKNKYEKEADKLT